jgi:hypothetical protein
VEGDRLNLLFALMDSKDVAELIAMGTEQLTYALSGAAVVAAPPAKFRLELSVSEAPALLAYVVAVHAEAHRLFLHPYQVVTARVRSFFPAIILTFDPRDSVPRLDCAAFAELDIGDPSRRVRARHHAAAPTLPPPPREASLLVLAVAFRKPVAHSVHAARVFDELWIKSDEKLVSAAAETASVITLQEVDESYSEVEHLILEMLLLPAVPMKPGSRDGAMCREFVHPLLPVCSYRFHQSCIITWLRRTTPSCCLSGHASITVPGSNKNEVAPTFCSVEFQMAVWLNWVVSGCIVWLCSGCKPNAWDYLH